MTFFRRTSLIIAGSFLAVTFPLLEMLWKNVSYFSYRKLIPGEALILLVITCFGKISAFEAVSRFCRAWSCQRETLPASDLGRYLAALIYHDFGTALRDRLRARHSSGVRSRHMDSAKRKPIRPDSSPGSVSGYPEHVRSRLDRLLGLLGQLRPPVPSQLSGMSLHDHIDAFIGSLQKGEKHGFYFLHSLLPHQPFTLLASGKHYNRSEISHLRVAGCRSIVSIVPSVADILGSRVPWETDVGGLAGSESLSDVPITIDDSIHTVDCSRVVKQRHLALQRKWEIFTLRGGNPMLGYAYRDLIGLDEGSLLMRGWQELDAMTFLEAEEYENVDLASDYLPARLTGVKSGSSAPLVALVVNHVVIGFLKRRDEADQQLYDGFVAEEFFREGKNTVRALVEQK